MVFWLCFIPVPHERDASNTLGRKFIYATKAHTGNSKVKYENKGDQKRDGRHVFSLISKSEARVHHPAPAATEEEQIGFLSLRGAQGKCSTPNVKQIECR